LVTELKPFTTISLIFPPTVIGQFTRMIQIEPKQVPSTPYPIYLPFLTRDIIVKLTVNKSKQYLLLGMGMKNAKRTWETPTIFYEENWSEETNSTDNFRWAVNIKIYLKYIKKVDVNCIRFFQEGSNFEKVFARQ
jgi:hypothetical protein